MNEIQMVDYDPRFREAFASLNKEWIAETYKLEPEDLRVLENPEHVILSNGGHILFAVDNGLPVGTVALLKMDESCYELAKMAVQQGARGRGIGERLCREAIGKAVQLNAKKLVLFTNRALTAAIHIYKKLGFEEVPLEGAAYARANVKMELVLA